MARVLSTAFLVALLAVTAGAFALTEGAKLEVTPIYQTKVAAVFSPGITPGYIDFRLRKTDHLTVWMTHDGKRYTIVRGHTYHAGKVDLEFTGVSSTGAKLPQGIYVPVVHLGRSHRTITIPSKLRLDTTPAVIHFPRHRHAVIWPGSGGPEAAYRVHYTLSEHARGILIVDGKQVEVTHGEKTVGELTWNGKFHSIPAKPGTYILSISAEDLAGNVTAPAQFATVQVRYIALGRTRIFVRPRPPVRSSCGTRLADCELAPARRARNCQGCHAPPARAQEARGLPALRHGSRPFGAGAGGRPMSGLAHIGGVVGCFGLALLFVGTSHRARLVGLGCWAAGCGTLVLYLAPAGHHRLYAAAAVAGVVAAGLLAWLFVRIPWTLAVAVLACEPARIPVSVGSSKADQGNLLLPLYLVVAAAAIALLWEFFGEDERSRELGPLAWPLALFVSWTGLTLPVGRSTGARARSTSSSSCSRFGLIAVVTRAAAVADRAG